MDTKDVGFENLCKDLGVANLNGWPLIESTVYFTDEGVRYLRSPGVILLSKPNTNIENIRGYLEGYGEDFLGYLDDDTRILTSGEALVKFAGQTCYCSFGPKRTFNNRVAEYLLNLKKSGHGSVFEHANYSFLLYGISRATTHEFIRHRAGFAYSQQSTRYVDELSLRFVERYEFQTDDTLHQKFIERINRAYKSYLELKEYLNEGDFSFLKVEEGPHAKTDRKKRINQLSRMCLPHELEAPIVVTGNLRAWRHFIEMRSHPSADIEIRRLAISIFACLKTIEPNFFSDYKILIFEDGHYSLTTDFKKV